MTNAINTTETTTHWEASGDGLGSVIDDTMQALHTLLLNLEANCFEESISDPSPPSTAPWCSRVWDGLLCWPPTPANVTSHLSCPAYIDGFDVLASASRHCTEDGTWFFNVQQNRTWTNYSSCGYATMHHPTNHMNTTLIETWLPVIKRVSQIGYSVSLVVLLIALCILASFKKLYCPRNTLHMHLFISFIMRAFMAILKGNLYSQDLDDVASAAAGIHTSQSDQHEINLASAAAVDSFQDYSTSWECKVVTAFWQYFIMANYSWILMEGLYLHNLIFMALFTDSSAITMYIILGWGLPLCFVALWIAMRVVYANHMCWTTNEHDWIFWIIRGPITASILINFVFFVHITWVLLSKLRSSVSAETRKYRYRKWAKSTLVLVPLFGVHYTVFCGMQGAVGLHEAVEVVWLFCDQLFASFQGFLVALLYCLMNGEVRGELARRWNRFRQNHRMESPWSQYSITNNSRTNTTRWRTSFHSIQVTSIGDRRDMRLRSLTPPLVAGCYDSSRSISNPSSLHNSTSCINAATTAAAAVGAPSSVTRRSSAGGILCNGLLARPSAIANNRLEKIVSESEESEQVEIRPLAAEPPPPQPSADLIKQQQQEVISLDCMSPSKPEPVQSSQSKTTL